MLVVAPDGDYAAYCGIWHEPGTTYALVEPVCTDPDHRRRGLGRAAVLEAARRCRDLGAQAAYVGSNQAFYSALGFTPHSNGIWWKL
nr:GNAT family N-acetyltransferase [Cryobacterium sp. TMT2-4]